MSIYIIKVVQKSSEESYFLLSREREQILKRLCDEFSRCGTRFLQNSQKKIAQANLREQYECALIFPLCTSGVCWHIFPPSRQMDGVSKCAACGRLRVDGTMNG